MLGCYLLLLATLFTLSASAQATERPPPGNVFVDAKGELRWQKTKREVALFGVNYTAPFAYSYRALRQLHIRPKKAID